MARRLPAVHCLLVALAFAMPLACDAADAQQGPAPSAPPAAAPPSSPFESAPSTASSTPASSTSLDRIRAGVRRPTFLAGERGKDATPTFRTEVTGHVIELRNYWSDRDPDMEPDPFTYPIPSAAELLINYGILKPRAALRAHKQRAIRKQIQSEIEQIERQRDATDPPPAPAATPTPISPPSPPPR